MNYSNGTGTTKFCKTNTQTICFADFHKENVFHKHKSHGIQNATSVLTMSHKNMSQGTKPTKSLLCPKRRLRSANIFEQSDQSLPGDL